MIEAYVRLAQRIRDERISLERSLARVEHAWRKAELGTDDQDAFIDSVALNLASFYTGLETLLALVARHVDGDVPGGHEWHRALLQQAAQDLEGIRKPVIGAETAEELDELRRFRHIVRHIYADHLAPENIRPLVERLDELWPRLSNELAAFADFLERVSDMDDTIPR